MNPFIFGWFKMVKKKNWRRQKNRDVKLEADCSIKPFGFERLILANHLVLQRPDFGLIFKKESHFYG